MGFLGNAALWLAYPALLLAIGFFTPGERRWIAGLRHPEELLRRLSAPRQQPPAVAGTVPEAYEAELRDEDARF